MDQQRKHTSDDLVLEILTRLPVKSLLRFRSVCKRWKSLISAYFFRKVHRQRHTSSPPLILTCHDSGYGVDDVDHGKMDYYLTAFDLYGRVIQQYTLPIPLGYIMIFSIPPQSKLLCFVETSEDNLYSYNPSTRQLFRLPDPPCFKHATSCLGYILSKDEYILVILVDKYPWVCGVLTFSISDDNFQLHYNEWRYIEVPTMLSRNITSIASGVFVCKAFYYEARDENGSKCILSFDVETEVFSTLRMPQPICRFGLLELKDELYQMSISGDSLLLNLWKLRTDDKGNKSWTLYKTFSLRNLGFTEDFNDETKFDWKIFIYRLEYLQCYNEPSNVLLEMGMLKLEDDDDALEEVDVIEDDDVLEEAGYYIMPDWTVNIHTNLFTL